MLSMKFATDRPFADPERIAIELINLPFLRAGGSADEYRAGIERAVAKGWLWRHGSTSLPEGRAAARFDSTPA